MRPIAIGSDHAGYDLKETVKKQLSELGYEVGDFGPDGTESVDYPDYGIKVAGGIDRGEYDRGILICGTGLGMSMVANRFNGVRAALCNDLFSAMMSRRHNDANILVMGGRVIGSGLSAQIVRTWLETPFEGGRHKARLEKFCNL
ncbi:MAG: ribose 5-phosphate isomerase B [Desulfobacteraceae bacterium]|nr:ribose 5-phosphate isomerase B [Desulfobacteraceae bacterium]